MKQSRLIFRSLVYYWRTNLPILAGVAIAVAVLSGALLVGQSVRDSLRRLLYERIGSVEYLITAERFFSEELALAFTPGYESCPLIYLKGVVIHEQTGIRSHEVNVYGVDERFWKFQGLSVPSFSNNRSALIGAPLAQQLNIQAGDGLLLRVETQQAIPREWLYGRRDNIGRTLRLNCGEILPVEKLGEFSLRPNQGSIHSIFVPLARLQKDLAQASRINAVLLSHRATDDGISSIQNALLKRSTLQDLGIKLRELPSGNGFSFESDRIILDDSLAQNALRTIAGLGWDASPIYTYLAISIRAKGREIPYSVITAADPGQGALHSVKEVTQVSVHPPADTKASIWLTDWAARDLGASIGDSVEVDYFIWGEGGKLETRTSRFQLAGVVSTSGDVDASLAPHIPGVTDARSINAWDPPFPLDLSRIRREDEEYWNKYKATPKAFISLAQGQVLWASRFGKLTALRISPRNGAEPASNQRQFAEAFLKSTNAPSSGFIINTVKEQGVTASRGSTDFGEYFVYFSSFLIAAAILLAALFFKLMVEQRAREIGILQASGYSAARLRRLFLFEGLLLSVTGSIAGLLGSLIYGWFMVLGLRTWWVDAVGTRRLFLHISWMPLFIGAGCGIVISMATLAWTLRALRRNTPRLLLTGVLESIAVQKRRAQALVIAAAITLTAALILLIGASAGKVPQMEGFFGSGFSLLLSILFLTMLYLRRTQPALIRGNGWSAFLRLGLRNAMHRPARSVLCSCLIASATFIVVSMEAFRQDSQSISLEAKSGTGGFPFLAESALPILHDPNSADGLDALGIPPSQIDAFQKANFIPFRERPGDDASCLNLYAPQEPVVLGAPGAFLAAGRFVFQSSLADTPQQAANPWLLLNADPSAPFIPAIADANTIQYILHLSLGNEIVIRGNGGKIVRLRLVAALKDSIFQGKLIISESSFLRAFPEQEGYRFFLLDMPQSRSAELLPLLKEGLADYGFSVESSQQRLTAYHRVENTYLSTFQSLGALGLVLGTAGLATILLRNVLERRQELALLRAVGYRRGILSAIILAEHVLLMLWGLFSGVVCAILAILPALHARGAALPLAMTAIVVVAVFWAGVIASIVAVAAAFRSPLLSALRAE
jgi:putative ABC transport system permease protein